MFFEEGWISVADVTREVADRVQSFHAAQGGALPGDAEILAEVALSVWEICDAATKAAVTAPDGQVVQASKALLEWDDPRKLWNPHLDLRLGNIGSAAAGETTLEALRARYGAFLHLPMILPLNGVQSSLTFLEEELRDKPERDEETLKVAAGIVTAAQDGQLMTRGIARRGIGANISRRKFKIAWALACDHHPALARSILSSA
jgi:hypothetical protein